MARKNNPDYIRDMDRGDYEDLDVKFVNRHQRVKKVKGKARDKQRSDRSKWDKGWN